MEKKSARLIIYIIFWYILIFQSIIQKYIRVFQYFDEILALLFFPVVIYKIIKNRGKIIISRQNIIMWSCLCLIIFIGLFSNFKYGYQTTKYVLSDLLVFIKFFLVYFLFEMLKIKDIWNYKNVFIRNIEFITIIFFVLTIVNYKFEIFPTVGYSYGLRANQLFFDHPSNLAAVCVALMASYIVLKRINKVSYVFLTLIGFVMLSTLRMKAIVFVIVTFIIILYIQKFNKKLNTKVLLIIGVLCCIVGYNKFYEVFIENDSFARSALMTTSFKIANDYFPIGTGFGTYGSYFSGENYSPVYRMYGIDKVWGLSEEGTFFISDSFWPMILGQFGYLGLILYLICIILIYSKIQKNYTKVRSYIYIAKIISLIYLLISSTSESAFVNFIAMPLAVILAL